MTLLTTRKASALAAIIFGLLLVPMAADADPLVDSFVDLAAASDQFFSRLSVAATSNDVVAAFHELNGEFEAIVPRLETARVISPYVDVASTADLPADVRVRVESAAESINRLSTDILPLLEPYDDNELVLEAWNRLGELFLMIGGDSSSGGS